uniref:Elongin-C n=2 Tax=Sus scrofa TaxID=9823 RepID=A0A4X1VK25_PIG
RSYGGCEGPDASYGKLIASDKFIVKREHVLTSGAIKAMFSSPGQFAEKETDVVNFRETPSGIPSAALWKVCMYLPHKVCYTSNTSEIPEFPINSEFPIAPDIALEPLMAANLLDC